MNIEEEQAFLNAVLARPDDDAPRLIFADWLDEQGDSDRASFIRLQIQRARLPEWNPLEISLRLREEALLARHQKKWKAKLPRIPGVTWGDFRRGFVARAYFNNFASFRSNSRQCWAAAPIEAVSTPWPRQDDSVESLKPIPGLRELSISDRLIEFEDVERLAASPVLSTLRVLEIAERSLGIEGFRGIIASPHLRELTTLSVPFNSIGNGAGSALFKAAAMPALSELDLSEVGSYGRYGEDPIIEADGLQSLSLWPGLAQLKSLKLSGNNVNREGLRALVRSKLAVNLKKLALRGNSLKGQEIQEFEAAHSALKLDELDLGENLLRDVGPAYLAISNCLRELKVLNIDRCEIHVAGATSLGKAPFIHTLRNLNVTDNGFGPDGLLALLAKRPEQLHTLTIANNDLGDEGANYLANFPDTDPLIHVNLSLNGLTEAGASELGRTKYLRNLQVLNVTHNSFVKSAAQALARSPLGKRLLLLDRTEA